MFDRNLHVGGCPAMSREESKKKMNKRAEWRRCGMTPTGHPGRRSDGEPSIEFYSTNSKVSSP